MEKEKITETDPVTGSRLSRLEITPSCDLRREHFHEEIELVSVTEGEILCLVGGKEIRLREGEILVIGSRVVHRLMFFDKPSQVTYLQIDIDPAVTSIFPEIGLLSCFLSKKEKKYSIFSNEGEMGEIVASICRELEKKEAHYGIAVKGSIYKLIAEMCRAGMLEVGSELLSQKSFKRILPALEYANINMSARITLDDMCRELNVDKYNFCKNFKHATGITFFDYLGYLRLRQAEELLITTDKNITEISLECGFSTPQYFNRFFLSNTGYSPTTYRKMLGEE